MKLSDYLRDKGEAQAALAERLGVSQSVVSRWAAGKRTPRPDMIKRIRAATGGKVKPGDWYE